MIDFLQHGDLRINMREVKFYESYTYESEELQTYEILLLDSPYHERKIMHTLSFDTIQERDEFLANMDQFFVAQRVKAAAFRL